MKWFVCGSQYKSIIYNTPIYLYKLLIKPSNDFIRHIIDLDVNLSILKV
jgi:hypothetical protein